MPYITFITNLQASELPPSFEKAFVNDFAEIMGKDASLVVLHLQAGQNLTIAGEHRRAVFLWVSATPN